MYKFNKEQAVEATKQWLDEIVVGLNFCPFAKKEMINNTVHYYVCQQTKLTNMLEEFWDQVELLHRSQEIETTLFIINNGVSDFNDYLLLVEYANELLVKHGYEGIFQLASFHPDYLFEGEDEEEASHYTNRSPLPVLHLIREASMEKVLSLYKEPESIPDINIAMTEEKGRAYFTEALERISMNALKAHK